MCDHGQRIGWKLTIIFWYLIKFYLFCITFDANFLDMINPTYTTVILRKLFYNWFKEKTKLFYSFFSNQCSLLKNFSKLPTNLRYVTDKRLHKINFTTGNIEKIIVSLNSNKAHGQDNISICMLKICGDTICKAL